MTEPSIPKKVYRFYSYDRAIQTLLAGTFRWSSPFSFNDPFDSQWDFAWQVHQSDAVDYESHLLTNFFLSPIAQFSLFGNQRLNPSVMSTLRRQHGEFHAMHSIQRSHYLRDLPDRVRMLRRKSASKGLEYMFGQLKNLRILCASQNPTAVMLWSHYADQHKGVAFEINTDRLLDFEPRPYFVPVKYVEALPKVFTDESVRRCGVCNEALVRLPDMKLTTHYVSVKEKWWGYETEWRAVSQVDPTRPGNAMYRPIEITSGAIERIILGCRFESTYGEDGRRSLERAASTLADPKPRIELSRASETDFKIDVPGYPAS